MGKVLIGCQGTSQAVYEYSYNGKKLKSKATFIALSKFLNDIEKIILFVTPKSRIVAEELIKEEKLPIAVEYKEISSTNFEDVIENMFKSLDKNPNAVIDLTQGYRHLPMLLLVAALIENIDPQKRRKIFFALEIERPSNGEPGKSTFIDITVYFDIVYFNQILYFFGKSVNIPSYLSEKIQNVELKTIAYKLAKFSNLFFENNTPRIKEEVSKLKQNLVEITQYPPLEFSRTGMQKAIDFLKEIEKINISSCEAEERLLLAEIYNKRNYQLNAVTNLSEALLCITEMAVRPSVLRKKSGNKYSIRNAYKRLLLSKKQLERSGKVIVSLNEFDKEQLSKLEKLGFTDILKKVDKIRNDMAHGFINNRNFKRTEKLSQQIEKYIKETKKILNTVKKREK